MAENSTCQNCTKEFYRPDPEHFLDGRIKVYGKAKRIIVQQAKYYCEVCLDKLFPGMIAPELHERPVGECGGGRWVNPKRGDTRS